MTEILRYPGCEMNALRLANLGELVFQYVVQLLGRTRGRGAECPVYYISSYFGRIVPVLWSRSRIAIISVIAIETLLIER
jgi:hypothetical protein